MLACVSDRPGSLARLLTLVAEHRANLLNMIHIREGLDLHIRETAVQLVLETRGQTHAEQVRRGGTRSGLRRAARVLAVIARLPHERVDHGAGLVGLGCHCTQSNRRSGASTASGNSSPSAE